ncbi:MAG: hypothetical protein ABI566_02430 [Pseudolysinimonas sp.]
MADFDDIDALLSSSLKKAAEPANSAGVADAIRSRVAGGDAGTTVAGATAPGWGGGGALGWLPWIGAIIAVGAVGATLGVLGVFGQPTETVRADDSALVNSSLRAEAPFAACPGGEPIGTLPAGARVLAVERDDDSANVGVRDPYDVTATLWLAAALVSSDEGQPQISSLPVGEPCPEIVIENETPSPQPTPTTEPTKPPNAPGDTTPPTVKPGAWSQAGVYGTGSAPYCNEFADIVVSVADNVGVTSVTAAQSHAGSSITQIGVSGGNYTFRFTAGVYSYPSPDLPVTVTFTAKDAANNAASANKTITIYNTCLI